MEKKFQEKSFVCEQDWLRINLIGWVLLLKISWYKIRICFSLSAKRDKVFLEYWSAFDGRLSSFFTF